MASESEDKNEEKEDKGAEASHPVDEEVTSTKSEINSIVVTITISIIASRILSYFDKIAPALAAPAAALYLMSTCPRDESFDGMKEFKRVLRGDRLYDDHPDKPKNFFEKTLARVNATIQAETDAFMGCQVQIVDIMGCVKIASIQSQTQGKYFYWLGAVHRWRYLLAREIPVEQVKKD